MPDDTILLPIDRLPNGKAKRHAALRDYFCDKDASSSQVDDGWELSLAWPEEEARHVDPRLEEGLRWWGEVQNRGQMAVSFRRKGKVLQTLYDTWTLLSWSEWLARNVETTAKSAVILHIDDHKDIGTPRIFSQSGQWLDAISGERISLEDPVSVRSAILSGAIGMGSFMTPFLHTFPEAEVRHLCQAPKATITKDYAFLPDWEADTLLNPGTPRPSTTLVPRANATGPGHYRITPSPEDWLDGIGAGPILLHIDMDYFNNRYDGDSDWPERSALLDTSLASIFSQIDEVADALARNGLGHRIEDIVIAYSPGFFPAEFWGRATDRLLPALVKICGE